MRHERATHAHVRTCLSPFGISLTRAADAADGSKADDVPAADCRCLIRATGAKQKISAVIAGKDHRRFMQSYGNIMKVSLDSLKKREKKREKKKNLSAS